MPITIVHFTKEYTILVGVDPCDLAHKFSPSFEQTNASDGVVAVRGTVTSHLTRKTRKLTSYEEIVEKATSNRRSRGEHNNSISRARFTTPLP